jgi:hypothetical protein
LQVLFPSHVTVPFSPTVSVHVLPPVHVDVQSEPHVPEQLDWPAQLDVQLVPQSTLQVFFEEQLNEALLGTSGDSEGALAVGPNVHVPPAEQSHVVPLQEHEPPHSNGDAEAP